MKYGDAEFSEALREMHRDDPRRGVRVELLDGTGGVYVTFVPCADFTPEAVSRATGEALGWFVDGYRRDHEQRGHVYDPVEQQAKIDAWQANSA